MRMPRTTHAPGGRARRGQSAVEFLFCVMFFMMLVTFVRTFVLFELDIFNQSNKARFKTLEHVRGSFNETDTRYKKFNDQSFQKISSWPLRPIPFILPTDAPLRTNAVLPERKLTWGAGTKSFIEPPWDVLMSGAGIVVALGILAQEAT